MCPLTKVKVKFSQKALSVQKHKIFLHSPTGTITPILWMGKQRPKELKYISKASLIRSKRKGHLIRVTLPLRLMLLYHKRLTNFYNNFKQVVIGLSAIHTQVLLVNQNAFFLTRKHTKWIIKPKLRDCRNWLIWWEEKKL